MGTGLRQSAVEQTPTASSKVMGHREMTPMRGNGGTHSKSPSSEMKGKGLQCGKGWKGIFTASPFSFINGRFCQQGSGGDCPFLRLTGSSSRP